MTLSAEPASSDRMRIGKSCVRSLERTHLHNSNLDSFGSGIFRIRRSGAQLLILSCATSTSLTSHTFIPSRVRFSRIDMRMFRSSSTTRICGTRASDALASRLLPGKLNSRVRSLMRSQGGLRHLGDHFVVANSELASRVIEPTTVSILLPTDELSVKTVWHARCRMVRLT
jgi:hypothetical protein